METELDDERYKDGKIYKLQLGNKVYVGSTINKLGDRFSDHKSDYKRFIEGKSSRKLASTELFKDNLEPAMGLIENFPCAGKTELCQRERYWQEILAHDTNFVLVNKYQAFRSEEEIREYHAEYFRKHSEANREHFLEYARKRYESNREAYAQNYQANREAILIRQSEKVTCKFCNRQLRRDCILKHQRTGKCKKFQAK